MIPRPGRRRGPRRRPPEVVGRLWRTGHEVVLLGLPVPLLIGALALAAAIGLLLSYALVLTTSQPGFAATAADDRQGGNILPAAPVLTEATLGAEVQDLVDAGYVETSADFDVRRCLDQQGIADPVLIMEEVAWGPDLQRSWLIVHTAESAETLRSEGGPVNASVVLPTCGVGDRDHPESARLWTGSTLLAPSTR